MERIENSKETITDAILPCYEKTGHCNHSHSDIHDMIVEFFMKVVLSRALEVHETIAVLMFLKNQRLHHNAQGQSIEEDLRFSHNMIGLQ